MAHELAKRRLVVRRQQGLPVIYDTVRMEMGFRADLVVEGKLIVEIKSIEVIAPVHRKQLLTYLRLAGMKLGFLINFNVEFIKNGITRVLNGL
ncbi:MAG TPA: GxxExxY protein [Pyrinomonadaceae bacterium]|nr:GxxExxY protein [Pyrinomonadaceae bacterium]